MLDGAEIKHVIIAGHNDHAARMLAGGALDAYASLYQPVLLRMVYDAPALLQVLFHIAVGRFILQAGDRARLEHMVVPNRSSV